MAQQTNHIPDVRKKVTAVEWLIDKVEDHFCLLPLDLIEQAKEMEKEQIVNAYDAGLFDGTMDDVNDRIYKQYYNETYGR